MGQTYRIPFGTQKSDESFSLLSTLFSKFITVVEDLDIYCLYMLSVDAFLISIMYGIYEHDVTVNRVRYHFYYPESESTFCQLINV